MGLLLDVFVVEGESVRLTNAVEHGVDRDRYPPVVQHGFFAGPALEPAPHIGRRPSTARTSRLFVRGDIRTIHVHSASMGSVFLAIRSEEHTSELQSQSNIVCRLLLEKKK